jgi:hypothetical protein
MWLVQGLIAARHLPSGERDLFGVHIRPIGDGPTWTSGYEIGVGVEAEDGMRATSVVGIPPATAFRAYHSLTVEVEAVDAQEAARNGFGRFQRSAAAIALAGGLTEAGPIVSVETTKDLSTEAEPQKVQMTARKGDLVIEDASDEFLTILDAVEHVNAEDGAAGPLLDMWITAERSYFLSFDDVDRSETILGYARVMEAVAQAVFGDLEVDQAAEAQTKQVFADLHRSLEGEVSLRAGKAAIRNAREAIQKIDIETLGQRMARAGIEIGLDDGQKTAGKELWRLRNTKVGHSGAEPVTNQEMVAGRVTADVYLRKYFDWRIGKLKEGWLRENSRPGASA